MSHYESHRENIEFAKSDDVRTVTVYQSDGSDGYGQGTWGYLVSVGGWSGERITNRDGGYASQDLAHSAAVQAS